MLNKTGYMTVRAYTAGGALPVEGAIVRIRGAEEENRNVVYSLLTDRDGVTDRVSLPAPARELSEFPSPTELPFAVYDIEIVKDGYFTKRLYNVPVFEGINSEQLIAMIPSSQGGGNYPLGNINANEDLAPI